MPKKKLGNATGFVIQKNDQLFLVTNWHVVSGTNPSTAENKGIPTHLQLRYDSTNIDISLENEPWLTYPKTPRDNNSLFPAADVVLLPLAINNFPENRIFDLSLEKNDIEITPGSPVSIIGYPFQDLSTLPIWITGFVASEPNINQRNKPLIYVNAAGYSGLSGSPVVVRTAGFFHSSKGLNIEPGYHTKFLGIYSGRVYTNNRSDDLVICNVWKASTIYHILNHYEI